MNIKPLAVTICSVLTMSTALGAPPRAEEEDLTQLDLATLMQMEVTLVTAQKRSENLQEVPIAISTVGSAGIERRGLTNLSQIADFMPNVTLDPTSPFSGSSSVLSAFIRGIGQNDFAFNLEPGVGVYVDGVYYARTIGAVLDLLDLQRIEVLKGAQGTLFGRNTIGGAISVITRPPGERFRWEGEATAGNDNRLDIRGVIDMPLIEGTLLSSVAFSSKNRDGYATRLPFPGNYRQDVTRFIRAANRFGDELGNENQNNLRGKLLWRANTDLQVDLTADFSRTSEQATPTTLLATNIDPTPVTGSIAGIYNTCVSLPRATLQAIGLGSVCNAPIATSGAVLGGANVDADTGNDRLLYGDQFLTGDIDTSYAAGSNFNIVDSYGASATLDWALAKATNLKSISAYRTLSAQHGVDIGGAPYTAGDASFDTRQRQYSQELQLTGTSLEERLKWLLGAYYFKERGRLTDFVPFQAGLIQVLGRNDFDNEAWALFTHLNFKLTPRLSATAGLRYTEENKTFEGQQRDLNALVFKLGFPAAAFPDPTDPTRIYPLGVQRKDFTNVSPRAGVEYKLRDDAFAYVSYSEGFKSGGWTTRLVFPETPDPNVAPDFDAETAATYEMGLKSHSWSNRLQLNLAAFHTDYDRIQVNVLKGLSPTFANAGTADIRGFEAEFTGLLTQQLTLSGSLGYLHGKYTQLDPAVAPLGLDLNDRLINAPDWRAHLAGDYRLPLGAGRGSLRLHLDYTYQGKTANDPQNTPLLMQDPISLVNASIGYAVADGKWQVILGGRNITDERYLVSGWDQRSIGHLIGNYSRPAEWYLTLRFSPSGLR